MEKDTFSERLKALEDRISAAKTSREPASVTGAQDKFTKGSLAWRMVTELVAGMLLGLSIGYGLDSLFGTLPVFLVLFCLLGFAAGVRTMIRTAEQVRKGESEAARLANAPATKAAPPENGGAGTPPRAEDRKATGADGPGKD
ncbi:MAG: AtpZ/AtpI family protein [Pseudomonadota bacterium]